MPSPYTAPLRLGLIDMNNGVANQAIRSFRSILGAFVEKAKMANPGLEASLVHVQPRNLGEPPPRDCDIYISSGGPDSPLDGLQEPWAAPYRSWLDALVDDRARRGDAAAQAFLVCYSFEIAVAHFGVAQLTARPRKFGIMPVYPLLNGETPTSPTLRAFGDRLFVWEHRNWQAVELNQARLAALGGELLARESRDGFSKGPGLMAVRFLPTVEGSIFHPEADKPGVMAWIVKPEEAQAVIRAYGELTYRRMLKTIDDPMRLARTYALLLPGWLARAFNAMSPSRGWNPVGEPTYDGSLGAFERPGGT